MELELYPLFILAVGVTVVLTMILAFRINAFIALITAALVVSFMSPGEMATKVSRVATAFGSVTGSIGIVIAMAAVIGKCLMDSGAAERIVRAMLGVLGEKRAPLALMGSGYILSVPVFFDTVFYLLVPLARSLWTKKRKNYVLYVTAIAAGGIVTHSMVPPTPGPLFMANEFGVDLGVMILVGGLVAIPMSVVGLLFCGYLNKKMPIEMRPYPGEEEPEPLDESKMPPLMMALLPVILPVLLIAANTIASAIAGSAEEMSANWQSITGITSILGNPSFALILSAAISLFLVAKYRGHSLTKLAEDTEHALMSGGLVILITAAGGSFGAMLREAGIQGSIQSLMGEGSDKASFVILTSAFAVAALIKFAQGSGTVSMITTSTMFVAMGFTGEALNFPPVLLICAIGSGSMVGDWMNNSGFWVFSKMSCLTTQETLKTWTLLAAVMGVTGFVVTLIAVGVLSMFS